MTVREDIPNAISVTGLSKSFSGTPVVKDVSFHVREGEIFGLLGPNGAGKTTTIRMILDIFKADQGRVLIFGDPINAATKDKIGYIPEERGLYVDLPLERCIRYLGSLKGLSKEEIDKRSRQLLEQFDLMDHRRKKVKQLSKGMQQKAQIITAIIHQPRLLIVDEPFTALDPVNTRLVKQKMLELRDNGTTIIMSTHQMHQVEDLCDGIVLIDRGRVMLHGGLSDIRNQYKGNAVVLKASGQLPEDFPEIENITPAKDHIKVALAAGSSAQDLLKQLVNRGITVEKFEWAYPSLDDIFISIVKGES